MSPTFARWFLAAGRGFVSRFPEARGVWRVMNFMQNRVIPALPAQERRIVRTADGRHFDECVHEPWFFNLLMHGQRDPAETMLLTRLVRSGDTVLDIGANYGWYATLLARLVGPTGRVHAFEPAPTTMELLKRNCSKNGVTDRIRFNNVGLGTEPGRATIHVPKQHGGASLKPYFDEPTAKFDIDILTVDDYVASQGIGAVRVVKLDVEGSEFPILKGARRLLTSPGAPLLLTEVSRATAKPFGYTPEDVMRFLSDLGYSVCRVLERPAGRLSPLPSVTNCRDSENVLCYPAARRDEVAGLIDAG